MSDAVYVALIAAIVVPLMGTVVTALGVAAKYIQDRANAKSQADRDQAAALLAKDVATKVEETRKDLVAQNANVDKKLDIIHSEVNSQLTKALDKVVELQSDIVTLKGLLISRMRGGPDVESVAAVAQTKLQSKVEEITTQAAEITSQAAEVATQAAGVTAQAAEIAKESK